jgi:hypothetical protein
MDRSDNAQERMERDPRNDRRHEDEVVVERPTVIADRRETEWPRVSLERRRGERRRIERMGTDI